LSIFAAAFMINEIDLHWCMAPSGICV